MTISPRLLERRRKAALVETGGFKPCTTEYVNLLQFRIIELQQEVEQLTEMLERKPA